MGVALAEYPLCRGLWWLLGPVPQPYPGLGRMPRATDVFADLTIPAVGFLYILVWGCFLLAVGLFGTSKTLSVLWGRSWLLLLAVLLHVAVHYTLPYLLIVTDSYGLTTGAAEVPPAYLNIFQPHLGRYIELPLVVSCVCGTALWRGSPDQPECPPAVSPGSLPPSE